VTIFLISAWAFKNTLSAYCHLVRNYGTESKYCTNILAKNWKLLPFWSLRAYYLKSCKKLTNFKSVFTQVFICCWVVTIILIIYLIKLEKHSTCFHLVTKFGIDISLLEWRHRKGSYRLPVISMTGCLTKTISDEVEKKIICQKKTCFCDS